MGGYLNYMYDFVCGNCLAKTYCFLLSTGQLAMPKFFFCQRYVCNGTNKRKLLHLYIKLRPPITWLRYNEANTEMHTRQADLFNLISH